MRHLQAKECPGLPGAPEARREAGKGFFLRVSRGGSAANTLTLGFSLQNHERTLRCCLRPPG